MHTGVPLPNNIMDEMEENKKLALLKGKKLYEHKKGKKEVFKKKQKKIKKLKNFQKKAIVSVAVIGGVIVLGAGLFWLISSRPNLPTISSQGHIEASPPSHIVTNPIPVSIQSHMLEHADGTGRGGIIIQYNCDDYECESDLIDKLTNIVGEYPQNVYLAPNNYDGKIILTKVGQREILDVFDAQTVRDFIED